MSHTQQELWYPIITIPISLLFFFTATATLDKYCLAPEITSTEKIEKMDPKRIVLMKQSTKSIDYKKKYRMEIRPSLKAMKVVFAVIMLIWYLTFSADWYYAHFFTDNINTIWIPSYQHFSSFVTSWYIFEMVILFQYTTVSWHLYLHHWCTVFMILSVQCGVYIPFAMWFGIPGVVIPKLFVVRKLFKVSFYVWASCTIINVIGIIMLMVIRRNFSGNYWWSYLLRIAAIIAFLFDDYHGIRHIGRVSNRKFEDIDFSIKVKTLELVHLKDRAHEFNERYTMQ